MYKLDIIAATIISQTCQHLAVHSCENWMNLVSPQRVKLDPKGEIFGFSGC